MLYEVITGIARLGEFRLVVDLLQVLGALRIGKDHGIDGRTHRQLAGSLQGVELELLQRPLQADPTIPLRIVRPVNISAHLDFQRRPLAQVV